MLSNTHLVLSSLEKAPLCLTGHNTHSVNTHTLTYGMSAVGHERSVRLLYLTSKVFKQKNEPSGLKLTRL